MDGNRGGRTEGSLLFFVLVLLAAGFVLVYLARTRNGFPPDAVDLNTATAEQIGLAFEIEPDLANTLVEHRKRLGGFTSIHQPSHLSLFPDASESARVRSALDRAHLDVNTADSSALARALHLPRSVTRRIAAFREGPPEHRFHRPA